jgi:hypothetical protein
MSIEAGKLAPIIDDEDQLLAEVWKSKPQEQFKGVKGSFPFNSSGSSDAPGGDDPKDPEKGARPQLSDIQLIGFEEYEDSSKMQKYKAKFRVYNSSGEDLEKFLVAITLSDTQGGRS